MPRAYEYTERDILRKEKEILENLYESSYKLEDVVKQFDKLITEATAEKYREKTATLLAMDEIAEYIPDIIKIGFMKAAIETEEFNYSPYLEHLMGAIDLNINEMVKLKKAEFKPILNVDFSVLGDISEWAIAVESVRSDSKWGTSRGMKLTNADIYPDERKFPDLATRMWAEKIYGTAREGVRIVKKVKDEKTGATKMVDKTKKYRGKYEETVRKRLSYLDEDRAPFWYLIEHGNATNKGFSKKTGEPYPKISPHPIKDDIESTLTSIFNSAYERYYDDAEEYFIEEVYRKAGIKGKAESFEYIPEDVESHVKDILERVEKGEEVEGAISNLKEGIASGRRTLISTSNLYVPVSATGKVSAQPRIKGQFGSFRGK